ncbi:MAG: alanyl-tRNA editing protein [Pseudomonadota bacterium]
MTELVFRDDAYARACDARIVAVDGRGLRLDRTVFYPTGGGQPGDSGHLVLPSGETLAVADTVKGEAADEIIHVLAPGTPPPAPGTPVVARLDWERRYAHMRLHTCLHLLSAVVAAPVTGGRIAADKAHLDFDIEMALLDKERIETRLNELIDAGHGVEPGWIGDEELDANPRLVKTMSVAPPRGQGRVRILSIPGVDLQPCGGTHVRNTREIGRVVVFKIRSEGRRNKRVTVGFAASSA